MRPKTLTLVLAVALLIALLARGFTNENATEPAIVDSSIAAQPTPPRTLRARRRGSTGGEPKRKSCEARAGRTQWRRAGYRRAVWSRD